jgi:hypothetical protein
MEDAERRTYTLRSGSAFVAEIELTEVELSGLRLSTVRAPGEPVTVSGVLLVEEIDERQAASRAGT